jgi:ribosomal protein L40E
MLCPTCSASIPNDAQFCIECGAPITHVASGATQRIAAEQGLACQQCQASNPAHATFCVRCGVRLREAFLPSPSFQTVPSDGNLASRSVPPPIAPHQHANQANQQGTIFGLPAPMLDGIACGIFLIGLSLLMMRGIMWPGIILLGGLCLLLTSIGRERYTEGIKICIWTAGLAFFLSSKWIWPGILLLIGVNFLIDTLQKYQES